MALKTPLYDEHVALGGKMVEFAGYELPVQYPAGVIAEHMAVRTKCGLFDVSHMGEVVLEGPDALAFLNWILTNDFTSLALGRARYSLMCNERGGCVDDLIVYRDMEEKYVVVVNAANHEKDVAWMKAHLKGDVKLTDISGRVAQMAVQGPLAGKILGRYTELPDRYYSLFHTEILEIPCVVAQTGYTGEYGFEIYCPADDAAKIWRELLKDREMSPCGLGARDTLRLEAGMPLYGHEMSEEIGPYETGLGFSVKMEKDFIGKEGVAEKTGRSRIGIRVTGRGIAREECGVYQEGRKIGEVTSGTYCPYLKGAYAMALVEGKHQPGENLEVDVRGRKIAGEIVELPFYRRKKS